jgi:endonuclease-3
MEKGIYTLVLRLESDRVIEVGSLGPIRFKEGYYAYTGSARGAGGLARVARHIAVMEGTNPARRWHIDRLLPISTLVEVVATVTGEDQECAIARKIGERLPSVDNFGSTDCHCPSHLHFSSDRQEILEAVRAAHPRPSSDEKEEAKDGSQED